MNKQGRSLIIKGTLILLSLVLLIFISSYAWFTSIPEPVSATGLSAKAQKNSDFEVAVGFYSSDSPDYKVTDFSKEPLNLKHLKVGENTYSIYDNWSPKDLTSDGVTIIRPGLKNRNSEVKTDPFSYTEPTPGKEYIMFDFIFKSDSSDNIDLASQSFAKAYCEKSVADGNLTPTDWGTRTDKSPDGNFSVDAIVGSLRVSFDPYTFTDDDDINTITKDINKRDVEASCIWIPRPDLFLNSTKSSTGEETFSLETNVDSSKGTYVHNYWNIEGQEIAFPNTKTLIGSDNPNEAKRFSLASNPNVKQFPICSCAKYINNDGKYYGKVRIYLWTEGQDTEARKALVGGQYSIFMDLAQDSTEKTR